MIRTAHPLRVVELFAGCGGLTLGLRRAGWEGVLAVEKDAMAFSTLKANTVDPESPFRCFEAWPSWLPCAPHDVIDLLGNSDFAEGLKSLRGTVDLVAGGPPCQGFSAGGKRDARDPRNELAFRLLDAVEILSPSWLRSATGRRSRSPRPIGSAFPKPGEGS